MQITSISNKADYPYFSITTVTSMTKSLSRLCAMQFTKLFAFDLIKDLKITKAERLHKENFYQDYLEFYIDKKIVEEYKLIK